MKDRIKLYRTSINKFITDNRTKYNIDNKADTLLASDNILPIISLTLISSLNKKNKKAYHGYYVALIIELLINFDLDVNLLMIIIKLIDENIILFGNDLTTDKTVSINCLSHEILTNRIDIIKQDKVNTISKLSLLYGWIFGGGVLNKEIISALEKAGDNLGNLIKLSETFDKDDYNNQFDLFIQYKQKFIETMVTYDIFSDTMKNIINSFEDRIDNLVS